MMMKLKFLRQTNHDQFVQLQTSESLKNIERFTVQPIRIAVKTDVPLRPELFEYSLTSSSAIKQIENVEKSKDQIIQLATNLTNKILQEVKMEFGKTDREILFDKLSKLERKQQLTKLCREMTPSFPHSIVTTHISPTHSTSRPLMFVSLDSESPRSPVTSPVLEIVKMKPTPIFTTSVTVTRPSIPLISSTTKVTNSDEDSNSTSTSIPNTTKILQINSKQNSLDSTDTTTTYDNTIFLPTNTGNITPARSLLSDYDNLRGSYGSLNDDNPTTQTITPTLPSLSSSPSTVSSSMTTIYESLENFPSSSSTTPTYVSAVSTFNTGGTRTPSQRLNSDISDEDLVESFDFERSSRGTRMDMFILFLACL